MFNEYFASIFNTDSAGISEREQSHNDITIEDITLSEEETVAVQLKVQTISQFVYSKKLLLKLPRHSVPSSISISKVLERCIFNNIKYHVYERLNPCQHGFIPEKSCITQLIEVKKNLQIRLPAIEIHEYIKI